MNFPSPFFSHSGAETTVSFSHAPFTSAGDRFTPVWLPAAAAAAALSWGSSIVQSHSHCAASQWGHKQREQVFRSSRAALRT